MLKPGASLAVVFNVLTPAERQKMRFGALVDCGAPREKLTADTVAAGRYFGKNREIDEKNNYRELVATH